MKNLYFKKGEYNKMKIQTKILKILSFVLTFIITIASTPCTVAAAETPEASVYLVNKTKGVTSYYAKATGTLYLDQINNLITNKGGTIEGWYKDEACSLEITTDQKISSNSNYYVAITTKNPKLYYNCYQDGVNVIKNGKFENTQGFYFTKDITEITSILKNKYNLEVEDWYYNYDNTTNTFSNKVENKNIYIDKDINIYGKIKGEKKPEPTPEPTPTPTNKYSFSIHYANTTEKITTSSTTYNLQTKITEIENASKYTILGVYSDSNYKNALTNLNALPSNSLSNVYLKIKTINTKCTSEDNETYNLQTPYKTDLTLEQYKNSVINTFTNSKDLVFEFYTDSKFTTKLTSIDFIKNKTSDIELFVKIKFKKETVVPNTYRITFDLNAPQGYKASGISYYENIEGTTYQIPNPTCEGHKFEGWYNSSNKKVSSNYTITKNETLTAHWIKNEEKPEQQVDKPATKQYTITFKALFPDVKVKRTSPSNITGTAGAKVVLENATCEGYDFKGWYEDFGYTKKVSKDYIIPNKNITLYAKWERTVNTIKYNPNGGTTNKKTDKVEYGDTIQKLPTATKKGYVLLGWYTSKTGGTKMTTNKIIKNNMTLYARWSNTKYSIKYVLNKGTNNKSNPAKYIYGGTTNLLSPNRKGYTFEGWYNNSSFKGSKITKISPTTKGNLTLYAKWSKTKAPASKVISIKNNKTKAFTTIINKNSKVIGYQVRYSTDKKFKFYSQITSSNNNITANKLKVGKTYYVKTRVYVLDSKGNKVYSSWTKTQTIKIKR